MTIPEPALGLGLSGTSDFQLNSPSAFAGSRFFLTLHSVLALSSNSRRSPSKRGSRDHLRLFVYPRALALLRLPPLASLCLPSRAGDDQGRDQLSSFFCLVSTQEIVSHRFPVTPSRL